MQASFSLHLLFSTFAIIHGTLKNFKFSSVVIIFTVSGWMILQFIYYRRNSSKLKNRLSSIINKNKKPKGKSLEFHIYQLRLLNDSCNYTVTYSTSTFTNRELSSLFDCDWSDKFDSHFNVVTRHYHFSTFW